ncbi:MAG: ORF6N domain-containing protein [Marinilabiliaceae bacterium]|nr:ORF6N domain-containing protein [Marinilabiliaceae bacterium]
MDDLSNIHNKIYEIRGYRVMLDFDLAGIYKVETRALNQAVKRNIMRFPHDFMFQLTKEEFSYLISQIVISSWGGTRKLPFAFTEQGVAMLSGLLNSEVAIKANINIMRAFVVLRQYALGYAELNQKLEEFMISTNMQFSEVYQALTELAEQKKELDKPRKRIGYV